MGFVTGHVALGMPFVTRLTLRSGDGDLLDAVVSDIKERAERKGVERVTAGQPLVQRHGMPGRRLRMGTLEFDTLDRKSVV